MTTNRISKYFEDDDPRAERYREVCDEGWRKMITGEMDISFGVFSTPLGDVEDFGFSRPKPTEDWYNG